MTPQHALEPLGGPWAPARQGPEGGPGGSLGALQGFLGASGGPKTGSGRRKTGSDRALCRGCCRKASSVENVRKPYVFLWFLYIFGHAVGSETKENTVIAAAELRIEIVFVKAGAHATSG